MSPVLHFRGGDTWPLQSRCEALLCCERFGNFAVRNEGNRSQHPGHYQIRRYPTYAENATLTDDAIRVGSSQKFLADCSYAFHQPANDRVTAACKRRWAMPRCAQRAAGVPKYPCSPIRGRQDCLLVRRPLRGMVWLGKLTAEQSHAEEQTKPP